MSANTGLSLLEKSQPIVLIIATVLGLGVGFVFPSIGSISSGIVYVMLIGLMFGIALGTPLKSVARSFKNLRFFAVALGLNFVMVPVIGFALALVFLDANPLIFVGFILYVVNPCTDWFLVFTNMAKGDVPMGLALLPINLVLQILLIPVYLWMFAGTVVPFQLTSLVETIVVFIILPFLLAYITNRLMIHTKGEEWKDQRLSSLPMAVQTLTLAAVVFFMFASQTEVITSNFGPILAVLIPVMLFFLLTYLIAQVVSRKLRIRYGECALLTCTTIARNSPLALAIAFGLFPDQPLIYVAIIIGVLVELPVLVVIVRRLNGGRVNYCKAVGEVEEPTIGSQ